MPPGVVSGPGQVETPMEAEQGGGPAWAGAHGRMRDRPHGCEVSLSEVVRCVTYFEASAILMEAAALRLAR